MNDAGLPARRFSCPMGKGHRVDRRSLRLYSTDGARPIRSANKEDAAFSPMRILLIAVAEVGQRIAKPGFIEQARYRPQGGLRISLTRQQVVAAASDVAALGSPQPPLRSRKPKAVESNAPLPRSVGATSHAASRRGRGGRGWSALDSQRRCERRPATLATCQCSRAHARVAP